MVGLCLFLVYKSLCLCQVSEIILFVDFGGKISVLVKKRTRGREHFQGNLLHVERCYIEKSVSPPGRQCHIQTMYPRVSLAQGDNCLHSQGEMSWRNWRRLTENSWLKYCLQWACYDQERAMIEEKSAKNREGSWRKVVPLQRGYYSVVGLPQALEDRPLGRADVMEPIKEAVRRHCALGFLPDCRQHHVFRSIAVKHLQFP